MSNRQIEVNRIADQLQLSVAGDAWCGSSLREAVAGVSAAQAAAHMSGHAHSIWEIVLHVTAWIDTVRRRIEGEEIEMPLAGDWSTATETNDAAWQTACDELEARYNELRNAIIKLDDRDLDKTYGNARDRASGAGVSFYVMLHGVVQHNLYHAGQISLLKRASS